MDQKRLFLAIAISVAILLGFQLLIAPHLPQPPKPPPQVASSQTAQTQGPSGAARAAPAVDHADGAQGRAAGADRGASPQGLDQPAGRATRRSGAHRLPRDAGAEFAGRAAAGAAVGDGALLRAVRLERRARRAGEAAGQRHGVDRSGRDAEPRQSRHPVVGQWRRPDLPDQAFGRRRLHVQRAAVGEECHRARR